jgi:hypothetical protein
MDLSITDLSLACPFYLWKRFARFGQDTGGDDEHHNCDSVVGGGEHDADPLGRWSQHRTTATSA